MPPGVLVCVWCTCVCHPSTAPHRPHHRHVSVVPAITLALVLTSHTHTSCTYHRKEGVVSQKITCVLLIGTEPNVSTRYTSTTYTLAHYIVYWICIDFRPIFGFLPSWTHLGEGNKTHDRASRRRSENTPGGTEIQEDKERHTRCQYVCGAKIALYNVWFSALADVRKRFCKICQNPLTSPFFDFFERQEIKSLISNLSQSLHVPIWHNLKLT